MGYPQQKIMPPVDRTAMRASASASASASAASARWRRRHHRRSSRVLARASSPSVPRGAAANGDGDDGDASTSSRKQYLRLARADDGSWALQSAIVTMRPRERPGEDDHARRLRIGALVHYGDASYFKRVRDDFASVDADDESATLCELITSEENLCASDDVRGIGLRRLSCALAPTAESRALAEAHGLRAQLDALDAEREGWFVADVTREELMTMRAEEELSSISGGGSGSSGGRGGMAQKSSGEASTKASGRLLGQLPPALEALYVTATGRAAGGDPVRLFTRLSCWFVPCPEAHLLLLDWVWGGGRPSDVLGALVDCCASGDLESARKLAFAQMIVSAQASGPVGGGTTAPVLVQKRNVVAMDGVAKAFDAGVRDVGLLYGGLHVDGLVRIARERFDYDVVDIEWRDAWRVNPPANESPLRYAIVPALLCVDGTDWAQTLHDVVALGGAASLLSLFLYIIRHGGLYYALGKWLLEWNRQLFETADDGLTAPTSVN